MKKYIIISIALAPIVVIAWLLIGPFKSSPSQGDKPEAEKRQSGTYGNSTGKRETA